MSKSISKKILLLLFVTVASLFFIYSANTGQRAFAGGGGSTEYTKQQLDDRLTEVKDGIQDYKAKLDGVMVVDKNDDVYDDLMASYQASLENYSYSEVGEKYLFGETGLNGLLYVYQSAYEFYEEFVKVDGDGFSEAGKTEGFYKFSNAKLIEDATEFLENFDVSDTSIYTGDSSYGRYSVANVRKFLDEFDGNVVQPIRDEDAEHKVKFGELYDELSFYKAFYGSAKYLDATVSDLFAKGESGTVKEVDLVAKYQTAINSITDAYDKTDDFTAFYDLVKNSVKEFKKTFENTKTAFQVKHDYIAKKLTDDQDYTFEHAMIDCEKAFEDFKSLQELNYYKKDGEGNYLVYDLKFLTADGESYNEGDAKTVESLLRHYVSITKLVINQEKIIVSKDYGVSAETEIGKRVQLATAMAECLTGFGELNGKASYLDSNANAVEVEALSYEYENADGEVVTVNNGSDLVEAFKQSFEVDRALKYRENGSNKSSSNLKYLKKVSGVTGEIKDDDGKVIAKLTVNAIDDDGNEILYFDVNAKLDIRSGASASVERNLYLILKGEKEVAKEGLDQEQSEMLSGKVLLDYLTLTIYEYRNPSMQEYTLLEIDESEELQVLITVDFLDEKLVEQIKDKTCAFSYHHVTVTDVYKEITWGDTAMKFKVSNFLNQSQLALANEGKAPLDLPKLLIFGAIALVGLLFLVWIIAIIIKHKKYKITFDARGGVNKFIKVRVGEKFNHPGAPARKGYKFVGWYLDKKGTVKFAATQLTRRKNLTVYAKWLSEKDYAKLSDKRATGAAQAGTNVTVVLDPRGLVAGDSRVSDVPTTTDTELAKIEAEKLSYEAKKAEEERKTEEIKLQALREIEEAKKNGEARSKAEEEAAAARAELDRAIADREVLESDARADERSKCLDEIRAISDRAEDVPERDVDAEVAKAREEAKAEAVAETEGRLRKEFEEQDKINREVADKIKALEESKTKTDDKDTESQIKAAYDEGRAAGVAEAKALEEAEATRKALEEAESKRKAEEEARVKAAYEEGVAARVAAEAKERELAEAEARRRAEDEERIQRAIAAGVAEKLAAEEAVRAEADAKARAEQEEKLRLAEEARARAEEEARARLEAEVRAREEAEARARAEAEERARIEAESRAKDEVIARERAEAEERARIAAEEAARAAAEEAARVAAEEAARAAADEAARLAAEEAARIAAEEAARLAAEADKFDVNHVFDVLKAEIYSYTDADDLGYGLEASIPACAMKVVGKTIELQVNLDKDDCLRKGYKVVDGDKLPVKFVIACDDDVVEANELVEETMFVNGLKKTCKAVITEATEQTRQEGFEHGLSKDKLADTPEEFYKVLRVFAKSFVLADDGEVEEKVLVKMFLDRQRVYLYVNYTADGLNECDPEMAALGLKSFMTVKTVDECKHAVKVIGQMMKENGLIRFPSEVSIAGEDCAKGFTYTLKK